MTYREGLVVRARGGFFDVEADGEVRRCVLRGKYRWRRQEVVPGDRVRFRLLPEHTGAIEEVLPRESCLVRPAVANVRQVVIVMSLAAPPVNRLLLDRLLVMAEAIGLAPVVTFNKVDLAAGEPGPLPALYGRLGYPVLVTSAVTGQGVEGLAARLQDNISVFAGPSGAGKSSLLNAMLPGLRLKTGTVSEKIGRGRHTTRHVELLRLPGGGWVADTPGFSQLQLPPLRREELGFCFPEIAGRAGSCRFSSCLHRQEPGCAVRAAVEAGEIDPERYSHYLELLEEVIRAEKDY